MVTAHDPASGMQYGASAGAVQCWPQGHGKFLHGSRVTCAAAAAASTTPQNQRSVVISTCTPPLMPQAVARRSLRRPSIICHRFVGNTIHMFANAIMQDVNMDPPKCFWRVPSSASTKSTASRARCTSTCRKASTYAPRGQLIVRSQGSHRSARRPGGYRHQGTAVLPGQDPGGLSCWRSRCLFATRGSGAAFTLRRSRVTRAVRLNVAKTCDNGVSTESCLTFSHYGITLSKTAIIRSA